MKPDTLADILVNLRWAPTRVLLTASRTWSDRQAVTRVLDLVAQAVAPGSVLVHGACPTGGDRFGSDWVRGQSGWTEEAHPADWQRHGRAAGPRRNTEMVAAGAGLALAFIVDGSRGATHCVNLAEAAGIPTWRWER